MSDLIARDAAIAAIEAVKRDFPDTAWVIDSSARIGLSRAALEVSALPSPWVSVKDKLPENGSVCLVCGAKGGMRVARLRTWEKGVGWTVIGTGKLFNASHWMELPAPPV